MHPALDKARLSPGIILCFHITYNHDISGKQRRAITKSVDEKGRCFVKAKKIQVIIHYFIFQKLKQKQKHGQ